MVAGSGRPGSPVEILPVDLGPGVRAAFTTRDGGVSAGLDVPIFYDPLISKLAVWAEDRPRALARGKTFGA